MENEIIIESGIILEEKLKDLQKVRVDKEKWETYYLDENKGEKWVKEFPYSYLQAGGPPQLRLLKKFPWES